MPSSGPLYPTSVGYDAIAPYDDNLLSGAGNLFADDATYASITATTYDTNDWSYLYRVSVFGFSIPAGATINGITVEVEGYGANGTSALGHIRLTKDGAAEVGDDKGTSVNWSTSVEVRTFGGSADLWGTTWTPDEINASTFGVRFANKATGSDADVYIDYFRITVTYTEGGGGGVSIPVVMHHLRQQGIA